MRQVSLSTAVVTHVSDHIARARTALSQHPVSAVKVLDVSEGPDGEIILTGRTSSHYYKQLAQHAVISVNDGRTVLNNIRVLKQAK